MARPAVQGSKGNLIKCRDCRVDIKAVWLTATMQMYWVSRSLNALNVFNALSGYEVRELTDLGKRPRVPLVGMLT
jgi:hypothetical protein